MEDIIFFAVIALSIVFSIVKNYTKESKKNEQRTIVKQPVPTSMPTPPVNNRRVLVPSAAKPSQEAPKPVSTFEKIETFEVSEYERVIDYSGKTKKGAISLEQHEENMAFQVTEHNYNETESEKRAAADATVQGSFNRIFKGKDELKKAMIYSTLLERKF